MIQICNFVIPSIIFLICFFLSYVSIHKWIKEEYNYENIFYWGLAFAIVCIMMLFYFVAPTMVNYVSACRIITLFNLLMFIWLWLQLFALASVRYHSPKEKKSLRFAMWVLLLMLLVMTVLIGPTNATYSSGFIGFNNSGNIPYDLYIQYIGLFISSSLLFLVMPIRNIRREYVFLFAAYICLLAYFILNIINITLYGHSSIEIGNVEIILITGNMFLMALSVIDLLFIK